MQIETYKFPFNSKRYHELEKKELILIKNGQKLNKLEYDELLDYFRQLVDYLCWQDKNKFLKLIESFLNSELDCPDFDSQFFNLRMSKQRLGVSKSFEKIENIDIDNQLYNLIELINGIMIASQLYQNRLEYDEDGFTEEVYEEKVVDLYQRYKKALVYDSAIDVEIELDPLLIEGSSIVEYEYKDSQVLQETMIFFTIVTGVVYTLLNPSLFSLIWK